MYKGSSVISQFVYELYKESRMKNISMIHKYNTIQKYHMACSEEGYNGTLEEYKNKYDDQVYTIMSYGAFMNSAYLDRNIIKEIFNIYASDWTQKAFLDDKWDEYLEDIKKYEIEEDMERD